MYHMLKVAASEAQPEDMELAPNDPATTSTGDTPNLTQTSSTEDPQAVINHLQQMHLKNQLDSLTSQGSPIANSQEFPTIAESHNNNNTQYPDAPWHNPAKIDAMKQSLARHKELRRAQREAAAARFFQPPSPNQGFKYLYIPTKARIPVGTLRTMFRRMGVNNAWLLDIHYPARHTAAVLIHNDFESEFVDLLTKHRISHNENFNPNSGSILEDPNLKDLSTTERDEIARRHQTTRLERAIQHIRAPVKYAVARYFYDKNYITKKFYDSLASDRYPQIGSIFNQTPDTSSPPHPDDVGQMLLDDDLNMSDEAAPGSPQH
ncbi:hypothetical protein RO3G_03520 [Rhizopus delemar RA 99-880]|uniref:Uncharacterized protein n=1 Tax=Rhizopus delemar (strain RA 99-880 / ATCC MYA-4621 / FGSC 9543 / NRRL 43880) TaxID=246409 RepID=I1BRI5_RHIO9|nr:hypothetical protein RO3G_03520 [Rhizopus delemar RA 99-880]|eukprot:EIE78815.1 hypothetical protein RO3G_03520 [Rhizopus delemar RA 99-880]